MPKNRRQKIKKIKKKLREAVSLLHEIVEEVEAQGSWDYLLDNAEIIFTLEDLIESDIRNWEQEL